MLEETCARLIQILGNVPIQARPDGIWLDAGDVDVVAMARSMLAAGARLTTMTAISREGGETGLVYHYVLDRAAVNIRTSTHANRIASITPVTQAAGWIEREIHDLYAVEFSGHPDPARLIRPPEIPEGLYREPGGAAGKAFRKTASQS